MKPLPFPTAENEAGKFCAGQRDLGRIKVCAERVGGEGVDLYREKRLWGVE